MTSLALGHGLQTVHQSCLHVIYVYSRQLNSHPHDCEIRELVAELSSQAHAFHFTKDLWYNLKPHNDNVIALLFWLQTSLVTQCLCVSLQILRLFSVPVKNSMGIFIRILLNVQIAFCRTIMFKTLILPIHKHRRPSHFLVSSLITFFRFLIYIKEIFDILGQIYYKVTSFENIVNNIVSLIFFIEYFIHWCTERTLILCVSFVSVQFVECVCQSWKFFDNILRSFKQTITCKYGCHEFCCYLYHCIFFLRSWCSSPWSTRLSGNAEKRQLCDVLDFNVQCLGFLCLPSWQQIVISSLYWVEICSLWPCHLHGICHDWSLFFGFMCSLFLFIFKF